MRQHSNDLDKVSLSLEGMPPSDVASTLAQLDRIRKIHNTSWRSRFFPKAENQILRDMVSTLALSYAQLQNSQNANLVQADKYKDFIKVGGDPAYFGKFLYEHFRNEFTEWGSQHVTFFQMAERLLKEWKGI